MTFLKRFFMALSFLMTALPLSAQIRLPKIISNGMVLQRDTPIHIWGWASQGEQVRVEFRGKSYQATPSDEGKWQVTMEPSEAGGPYTMLLSGKNNIRLEDILVGEVWLCAGQSNMVHQLNIHDVRYADVINNANNPEIRQFWVPTRPELQGPGPRLPQGDWKSAVGEEVRPFSAVAYFYARKLYDKYQVPIGLVNTSVGGTPIEAWISEEGLRQFPEFLKIIEKNKDTAYVAEVNKRAGEARTQEIHERPADQGLVGPLPWYSPAFQPAGWRTINIPGYWEDQGARDLDGVVWYRKEVVLPSGMAGKPARVFLGRVVDADALYINGKEVGHTTYKYPQRRYEIPEHLLTAGRNTFAVRVTNYRGKGGFVPDKPYCVFSGKDTVDLKGYWQYKVGAVFPPGPPLPEGIIPQYQPAALFNGMVAPLRGYSLKGVLWYQGESNADRPQQYAELLPSLIRDWRGQFGAADLPFIFAQLPNYMDVNYLPEESDWAELRESQTKALKIPHTAMTVNIDLGEWNDIHPDNKKDVGERMALAAEKIAYGEAVVASGPIFAADRVEGSKIRISFAHTGSGLVTDDGQEPNGFAIAGEDENFQWAHAKIEGDQVVVWNDAVPSPRYVRYAWADNPDNPNLYNREGLPASPFRNYDPAARMQLPWQGKKATVVLTYDDALDVHLDHVIPLLDSLGLKATFYLTANSAAFRDRLAEWRSAAENGHELGNHTLFHPCDGQKPGMAWVPAEYDLQTYSLKRMADEIRLTNTLLQSLDGKNFRTFAYPCGDFTVGGDQPYIDEVKGELAAARGVYPEMHPIDDIDLYHIDSYPINGESGEYMINLVRQAIASHSLLVFLFHGVGGGHSINVSAKAHRQLLEYLKQHREEVWTAPLIDVIDNLHQYQSTIKNQ